MTTRRLAVICGGLVMLVLMSTEARAELTFCNDAPIAIDTAVGELTGGAWQARGWWTLQPGTCAVVVAGDLPSRYYYTYAESGGRVWGGDVMFCTDRDAFTMPRESCDLSARRGFSTLDTGEAKSYWLNFACDDCVDTDVISAIQGVLPELERYADALLPTQYTNGEWEDVGPVDIKYGVTRGPIRIGVRGSKLTVSVIASYWIAVSNLVLGVRFDTASCGIDEERPLVEASLSTVLGVNDRGVLTSRTRIENLSFPGRCALTFANIDVTDHVEALVSARLQDVAATIDARIGALEIFVGR